MTVCYSQTKPVLFQYSPDVSHDHTDVSPSLGEALWAYRQAQPSRSATGLIHPSLWQLLLRLGIAAGSHGAFVLLFCFLGFLFVELSYFSVSKVKQ